LPDGNSLFNSDLTKPHRTRRIAKNVWNQLTHMGLGRLNTHQILYDRSRPLDRREKYRMKALLCLLAAEKLHDPTERVTILQIAQSWMSLADYVVGRRNYSTAHRSSAGSSGDRRQNDS
jgi:hypothetical protein